MKLNSEGFVNTSGMIDLTVYLEWIQKGSVYTDTRIDSYDRKKLEWNYDRSLSKGKHYFI